MPTFSLNRLSDMLAANEFGLGTRDPVFPLHLLMPNLPCPDPSPPLIDEAQEIAADPSDWEEVADVMAPLFVRDAHEKGRIRLSDVRDYLGLVGLDGSTEIRRLP